MPGIPLSDWSGSGATERLRESLEVFNAEAAKQTRQLVLLTRWIVFLTAVLVAGLGVQLWLALK